MSVPDPIAAGMIDLHAHLLPGVDDGCATIEESLAAIADWAGQGVKEIVCTPHCGPNYFPQNTPDRVSRAIVSLREEVEKAGLAVRLHDGGEVRITRHTVDWFSFWGLPTIGEGNWLLLDWWGREWPDFVPKTMGYLVENGYQPLFAHPERMDLDDATFARAMRQTADVGALLQGNLNSLSGGEGPIARDRSQALLRDGSYFALASDLHRPNQVAGRARGIAEAVALVGPERCHQLLIEHPRRVVCLADRFA